LQPPDAIDPGLQIAYDRNTYAVAPEHVGS